MACGAAAALAALFATGRASPGPGPALRLVQRIPLPGVEGRIDHMACDAGRQTLYVAALGSDSLEIVDLRAGRRVHRIPGLHEPQGVGVARDRIFVANAQGGECDIFDASTYRRTGAAALGDDADNVRVDASADRVYVGFGNGALAVLDGSGRRVGAVPVSGHPESFQLEAAGPRVFVNVPASGAIDVVDRHRAAVVATWRVAGARSNFPMALDEAGRRLFVGCRSPSRLLVYDTTSGRQVAVVPIDGDTDDVFYDAARKRVYVSCGDGFVDVIDQRGASDYAASGRVRTAAGARTSLFVPQLGCLYVAVPHRGQQPAEVCAYRVAP